MSGTESSLFNRQSHRRPRKARSPAARGKSRVLREWRRIDLEPLEETMFFRAKKTHEVLKGVLKNLNLDRKQSETEILKVWNQLIDPTITKHAQPTGIHQGTIFITVDSSVWLSEIVRYHRKEILDRLQYSFGSDLIVRISFAQG